MKKSIIFAFLSLMLCSSCTSSIAMLSSKLSNIGNTIRTKANNLFIQEIDDTKLVVTAAEFYGAFDEEFVPLNQEEMNATITNAPIPQPAITPGSKGSPVPTIDKFKSPGNVLGSIFKKIYFHTDQYTPKDADAKKSLQKIANHLKKHPSMYIFIEGHCDQRASESYNLALGTKRANTIRKILINYGANPNQLYSISYGKERPVDVAKNKNAYAKNRRVSFKIYAEDKKI